MKCTDSSQRWSMQIRRWCRRRISWSYLRNTRACFLLPQRFAIGFRCSDPTSCSRRLRLCPKRLLELSNFNEKKRHPASSKPKLLLILAIRSSSKLILIARRWIYTFLFVLFLLVEMNSALRWWNSLLFVRFQFLFLRWIFRGFSLSEKLNAVLYCFDNCILSLELTAWNYALELWFSPFWFLISKNKKRKKAQVEVWFAKKIFGWKEKFLGYCGLGNQKNWQMVFNFV